MTRSLRTCQTPGVIGETGGRLAPSALSIGLEKVNVMFVCGVIVLPGAGLATAPALIPAGNQLTIAGGRGLPRARRGGDGERPGGRRARQPDAVKRLVEHVARQVLRVGAVGERPHRLLEPEHDRRAVLQRQVVLLERGARCHDRETDGLGLAREPRVPAGTLDDDLDVHERVRLDGLRRPNLISAERDRDQAAVVAGGDADALDRAAAERHSDAGEGLAVRGQARLRRDEDERNGAGRDDGEQQECRPQ